MNPWRRFRSLPRWKQVIAWVASPFVAFFVAAIVVAATGGGSRPSSDRDAATLTEAATTETTTPTTTPTRPTTTTPTRPTPTTTPTRPTPTTTTPTTTPTRPTPTTTTPTRPTPTTTAPTTPSPATGTALAALERLAVKGRAPKTGYSREQFGGGWATAAGCATRDRILQRDLVDRTYTSGSSCRLQSGTLHDPYTGETIRYVRRNGSNIDIDHVVALMDAWQKGAQQWSPAKRKMFANDPLNLLAVGAAVNRAKADSDAATWLPPRRSFRCEFVAIQIAVKYTYGLWVTGAERDAMSRILAACPNQRLPTGTTPPTTPQPTTPPPTTPPPTRPPPTTTSPSTTGYVHPGAFCSVPGSRGVTSKGASMVCKTSPTDNRLRWRRG